VEALSWFDGKGQTTSHYEHMNAGFWLEEEIDLFELDYAL